MILSPLQLEKVLFRKVSVTTALADAVRNDEVTLTVTPSFDRSLEDKYKWKISLDLSFEPSTEGGARYSGEISLTGFFLIEDKKLEEEKHLNIVSSFGPAVLFGCARDMVISITSQSELGTFILPMVSFVDQKILPKEEFKRSAGLRKLKPKK